MQRMALALIVVSALVAGVAAAVSLLRRPSGGGNLPARHPGDRNEGLQKIAFALLTGLLLYTAFGGAG